MLKFEHTPINRQRSGRSTNARHEEVKPYAFGRMRGDGVTTTHHLIMSSNPGFSDRLLGCVVAG